MEPRKMIWLSVSLFSSKVNWHGLLSEAIVPFTQTNRLLKGYKVEFNYLSGENIRLGLLTDLDNEDALATNADIYLKNYFEKANLQKAPIKLPVDGIFMPFTSNTIQYGLYPPVTIGLNDLDRHTLSINLSKIIVTALQDEIDDETIITFAFYLQISLVKVMYKLLNDEDLLLAVIPSTDNFKADDNALSNLSLMKEITDDVIQTEEFDSELNWLNDWIGDCKTALLTAGKTEANTISNMKSIYNLRVQTVYSHLGINMHGRDMLNYFVIKSLEQHFLVSK